MEDRVVSGVNTEIIASLLRQQISILEDFLRNIEQGNRNDDYIYENLKRVEKNLKWLRKLS